MNSQGRIYNNQHGISNIQGEQPGARMNSQGRIYNNPSRPAGSRKAGEYPISKGNSQEDLRIQNLAPEERNINSL